MQGLKVTTAMIFAIFTIYIFHCGGKLDLDFIKYLESQCLNFVVSKVILESDFYDNTDLAFKVIYNLKKMRKNSPCIFLISKTFLDSIWGTQYKNDILKFMLAQQTLILLMNDISEDRLRIYSTQLLQKNITKLAVSELYEYTVDTLELYFIKKLLTVEKEKPHGKYCIQNKKLEFEMKEFIEDFREKTKICETQEEITVRKRKLQTEEIKVEEKTKIKKKTKKRKGKQGRITSGSNHVATMLQAR